MVRPAPLTVVGGFLGAGKTTLVNHILGEAAKSDGSTRYAVLVNDFGDLAIDDSLIARHDGTTIALANGCICCTIGDDLIETIMDLMEGENPPDHLIVEASGVADPRPISELGSLNPHLARDLTLVVIDAGQVRAQWGDERLRDTVERQIRASNILLINKVEDHDAEDLSALNAWLDLKAPGVPRVNTDRGGVPLSIFDDRSFDETGSTIPADHNHDHTDVFQTCTLDVDASMNIETFSQRAEKLPPSVLRAKGYVTLSGETRLFQKVGPRSSLTPVPGAISGGTLDRIVVIGIGDLPPLSWFSSADQAQ